MFHVDKGLCFERTETGNVRIIQYRDGVDFFKNPNFGIVFKHVIEADSWASVMAAVSKQGATSETIQKAKELHGQ